MTYVFPLFSYTNYVKKLVDHPFLLSPVERVRYLRNTHHDLSQSSLLNSRLELQVYQNWNSSPKDFETFLYKVYRYRKCKKYRGAYPSDLLRFMRNVYEHYKSYDQNVTDADVDAILRRRWPGFLDQVHILT